MDGRKVSWRYVIGSLNGCQLNNERLRYKAYLELRHPLVLAGQADGQFAPESVLVRGFVGRGQWRQTIPRLVHILELDRRGALARGQLAHSVPRPLLPKRLIDTVFCFVLFCFFVLIWVGNWFGFIGLVWFG